MPRDDSSDEGPVLLALARAGIGETFGEVQWPPTAQDWLERSAATFVTLTRDGKLRGCIGSVVAYRSLRKDVVGNARAAALSDSRFTPVTARELPTVRIEVSVLSPPAPVSFASREALEAGLHPGVDGLIVSAEGRRAVFLPQVWEVLPKPADFLDQLLAKGHIRSLEGRTAAAATFSVTSYIEPDRSEPEPPDG